MVDDKPSILIVDDKKENLVALERILSGLDVTFVRATSGNAALIQTLENDFAIALMDVQMPEMDGFETVALMREDKRTRELPVIFLSAIYKDDYYQIKGIQSGAVDFITKPVVPEILIGKVKIFLDLYQKERKLKAEIALRKEAEIELKKYQEELEMRVHHRTNALKEAQAQLVESEKLSALGVLTAGVAHELNNPMMGILNFVQYSLKHLSREEKIYEVLKDAERETRRCIDIVSNLLTFSRMEKSSEERFQKAACSRIIDRVLNLLKYRTEKEDIHINRSTGNEIPLVHAKISNLQQVFLNIIGNALDALSSVKDKTITIDTFADNEWVTVTIADSGSGIDPKIKKSVFDPFFTTKPPGKGTGLGLSVSRSIIDDHRGKISFKSKSGEGTVFMIRLPIAH